jgi:hypothetical protein
MKSARLGAGLVLFAAGTLAAQSPPPIRQPKEAAQRAVTATNAHTTAMTDTSAQGGATGAPRPAPADSVAAGIATQTATGSTEPRPEVRSFEREIFRYDRSGRRDPFVSLMASGDLRPVITDLRVIGILYDAAGRNSTAILRDLSTKEQYRVRMGQSLGRIRVARIDPKSVTFTIEEFGFSRQETLPLGDPNKERSQ